MIRKYPCNREYEKVIRYNGTWFKLKSIFDADAKTGDFDFNRQLQDDDQFDFNKVLDMKKKDIEQQDEMEDAVLLDPSFDDMEDFCYLN